MRILHLLSQQPEFTGSGIYLQNLIEQAAGLGHENFLVAGIPLGSSPRLACLDLEHSSFVSFNGGDLPFPIPGMSDEMPYASSRFSELQDNEIAAYQAAFSLGIKQAIDTFQPDIIHTHHLWLMSSVARQLEPQIPMVVTCHSTDLRQFIKCPRFRPMVETSCRAIDRVMALSPDQAKQIGELYQIPKHRIQVVGGGFDDQIFQWKQKETGPPVHLLYAGKLSRAKGVLLLLRSLAKLSQLPIHLHLVGSGSGKEEAECRKLAAQLHDRVTLHGRLPQHRLASLMRTSHLFILPSFFEGLPLVLLEALASGCRVVATDLPGCREILGPREPGLVDLLHLPPLKDVDRPYPEDEARLETMLAECIERQTRRILKSPSPDPLAVSKLTSPFTWQSVFAKVDTIYQELLSARGLR